jgi:Lon protease-like protein
MAEMLPLFPLGAVLYPGMLLPLHIFEERYRQLVRDLLERPEPRRFGVIAIRKGRETGIDGVHSLYQIGCTATLRRVDELDDGRFDLVTVGTQRFRLLALDQTLPYLQGEVERLAEDVVDQAAAAPVVRAVQVAFRAYLDALTERGGATVRIEDLPPRWPPTSPRPKASRTGSGWPPPSLGLRVRVYAWPAAAPARPGAGSVRWPAEPARA